MNAYMGYVMSCHVMSCVGIANGFPLSAIGTRSDLSALLTPGGMGGKNVNSECPRELFRQDLVLIIMLLE